MNFLMVFPVVSVIVYLVFFIFSSSEKWEIYSSSIFECGFSSYFYSRNSFSIHYYLIGLIFLFLDLEICVLMPFLNLYHSNFLCLNSMILFLIALLLGVIKEWLGNKLSWFH